MPVTLPNGVIVPNADGQELISATGVAEMRALGSSADAQLAVAKAQATSAVQAVSDADAGSRARDTVLEAAIAGMEGMTYVGAWQSGRTYRINDVVTHGGDSWARLTAGSAGIPGDPQHWGLVARKGDGGGFGALTETAVPGLYDTVDNGIEARLAALNYDSGLRNITAGIVDTPTSGGLYLRRQGNVITYSVIELLYAAATPLVNLGSIPVGFRPSGLDAEFASARRSHADTNVGLRVRPTGNLYAYRVEAGRAFRGSTTWITTDPIPAPSALPGATA